ncbi:MAG: hypothetical protein ABFD60_01400 [Bryobacteraceae bacterium]
MSIEVSVAEFLDEINDLLENVRLGWGFPVLEDIKRSVTKTRTMTEAQRTTVDNIAAGRRDGLPSSRFRSSRRYEGWTGNRR